MPVERWERSSPPRLVVRLPDGSAQGIPLAWTDHAGPSMDESARSEGARLLLLALLEAVTWVQQSDAAG